jgi:hypothetical protein
MLFFQHYETQVDEHGSGHSGGRRVIFVQQPVWRAVSGRAGGGGGSVGK